MTNGLSVSLPVPCKVVIVVKHDVLPSVKRVVMESSSPAPNARLVQVEIVCVRPLVREEACLSCLRQARDSLSRETACLVRQPVS